MVFDKAWNLVKTRGFDIRDHNGEEDYLRCKCGSERYDKGIRDRKVCLDCGEER